MVFGVAMRITNDAHDAEDATQAVFLSLALQAKQSREIKYIGPWLQQVAKRLALDIKRSKSRRKKREENFCELAAGRMQQLDPADAPDQDETKRLLGEELNRLPAKYRLPLILHYFGGMSRDEMARELGCKPSTLGVRVHRGRAMLGNRLAARGVAMSGGALVVMLTAMIRASVSQQLVWRTSHAATQLACGYPGGALLPLEVMRMARGATRAVMVGKIKAAAIAAALTATAALAATGQITRVLPSQIRAHFNLNVTRWVRPLFDSFRRPLQVNSGLVETDAKPQASLQTDSRIVPLAPPEISLNAQTVIVPPAVASSVALPDPPLKLNFKPQQQQQNAKNDAAAPQVAPMVADRNLPAIAFTAPVDVSKTGGKSGQNSLRLAEAPGQIQHAVLHEGILSNSDAIIGDRGAASFDHTGGTHYVSGQLVLGNSPGASGTYNFSAGDLFASAQTIGRGGTGRFTQTGGVNHAKQITVGADENSNGTYELRGATVDAGDLVIGDKGSGTYEQDGGDTNVATFTIGKGISGSGLVNIVKGNVNLEAVPAGVSNIVVSSYGSGTINLGNATSSGEIKQVDANSPAKFVLRADAAGTGRLDGWGPVHITGNLFQNGQVIADGHGNDRTLDMSSFNAVRNTIDNSPNGGTNGWFAVNGGKLNLPPVHVHKGTGIYTWGEDIADPKIDLVNSVRMRVIDADQDGMIKFSLLSMDRDDIPELPLTHHFIGLWKVKPAGVNFSGLDLLIRYDDSLASRLGLNESVLKLWEYDVDHWQRIYDDSFGLDTADHLIAGHADGTLSYFAVSAPEPSGLALVLAGSGVLLRRRRR